MKIPQTLSDYVFSEMQGMTPQVTGQIMPIRSDEDKTIRAEDIMFINDAITTRCVLGDKSILSSVVQTGSILSPVKFDRPIAELQQEWGPIPDGASFDGAEGYFDWNEAKSLIKSRLGIGSWTRRSELSTASVLNRSQIKDVFYDIKNMQACVADNSLWFRYSFEPTGTGGLRSLETSSGETDYFSKSDILVIDVSGTIRGKQVVRCANGARVRVYAYVEAGCYSYHKHWSGYQWVTVYDTPIESKNGIVCVADELYASSQFTADLSQFYDKCFNVIGIENAFAPLPQKEDPEAPDSATETHCSIVWLVYVIEPEYTDIRDLSF